MAKKVYAIKEGYNSTKGEKVTDMITDSWSKCESFIKGVKGAKYKSFTTLEEAQRYLSEGDPILKKGRDSYPMDVHHAYVDGSYNVDTGKFSYGLLVTENDVISYLENGSAADDKERDIRQIGGELRASIRTLEYCVEQGIKEVVIFHDYEGVCYHATGYWERREESSKQYYESYQRLTKDNGIKVHFVKVDSHTGDLYNEIVDEFAKAAGGLRLNWETEKLVKSKIVMVSNIKTKEMFNQILKSCETLGNIRVINE